MTALSAQAQNELLREQIDAYQAYFDGKAAGFADGQTVNPHPVTENEDIPSPYSMWQDGYEEAKSIRGSEHALGVASTMLRAMKEFFDMMETPPNERSDGK